jgi:hypothetical protein
MNKSVHRLPVFEVLGSSPQRLRVVTGKAQHRVASLANPGAEQTQPVTMILVKRLAIFFGKCHKS